MPTEDPYQILGVARDASQQEIKSAYRELALRYHPDRNRGEEGAEEAFKRVSWAYQILSDPERRRRYGRRGGAGLGDGFAPGDLDIGRAMEAFRDVVEMVGTLFAGAPKTEPAPMRGDDLEGDVGVGLEELVEDVERRVEVPGERQCRDCGGEGTAVGTGLEECPACGGRGNRREGLFGMPERCGRCQGTGEVPAEACPRCGGSGFERSTREVIVEIPAGVRDGQKLRQAGRGAPGRFGGASGDLLIEVRVEEPEPFSRRGDDVLLDAAISHSDAALGGRIRVPTLEGDVWMRVPAGTSTGDRFRLQGRGLPNFRTGRRGDQIVTVSVETAVDLTERQQGRVDARRAEKESTPSLGDRIRSFLTGTG